MAKLVDKTYGEALFQLALESSSVDRLFDEAKAVLKVFQNNADIKKFLNHPKISKEEKTAFIENVFNDRVSDDFTGFMLIVIKKDRQNEIEDILEYFIEKIKEYKKIGIVSVKSATELTDEQKDRLVNRLLEITEYKTFEIDYAVDSTLLGGMIIRIGDRVVDSSIKTKINSLSRNLYNIQLT